MQFAKGEMLSSPAAKALCNLRQEYMSSSGLSPSEPVEDRDGSAAQEANQHQSHDSSSTSEALGGQPTSEVLDPQGLNTSTCSLSSIRQKMALKLRQHLLDPGTRAQFNDQDTSVNIFNESVLEINNQTELADQTGEEASSLMEQYREHQEHDYVAEQKSAGVSSSSSSSSSSSQHQEQLRRSSWEPEQTSTQMKNAGSSGKNRYCTL